MISRKNWPAAGSSPRSMASRPWKLLISYIESLRT
jgi:hypothetical protein